MSFEKGQFQRPVSPPSLERSASSGHNHGRAGGDDGPNRKDKNYRRYASGVERSLALFETTLQEWADYISFLSRLLKALQARPNGSVDIPHKTVVAKRLAQCLNPDLPSGVHQKTLELYAYIFSVLNRDGLGRDLSLYLPGLSPTLAFASLSVKPTLLSLFETFILAVSPIYLRSALKAILLALLPGLEDETSEEYERTYVILNKFRAVVGLERAKDSGQEDVLKDQFFWQCLFLASITSSSRRQGALSYLTRSLPKLGTSSNSNLNLVPPNNKNQAVLPSEIEAVASPEPGLLIRCFDAGLRDEQLLIQRGFLDLLVTHLPLHSDVLHTKVASDDLERLVAAAVSVVGRREMSLNRRLWTWFLGPESSRQKLDSTSPSHDRDDNASSNLYYGLENRSEYFERYGLNSLVSSIRKLLLDDSAVPLVAARPFRICLSLMDRWEIGGLVVPLIFWEALESVWRYQRNAPSKESFLEVLRSAAVFFDGIESDLIWAKISNVLQLSFQVESLNIRQVQDRLDLVHFIITKFNIQEEEMLLIHVPIAVLLLLVRIRSHQRQPTLQQNESHANIFATLLKICSYLIDIIPSRALLAGLSQKQENFPPVGVADDDSSVEDLVNHIGLFYERKNQGVEKAVLPVPLEDLGGYLVDNSLKMVVNDLMAPEFSPTLKVKLAIFDKLIRKFPSSADWGLGDLLNALEEVSKITAAQTSDSTQFERISIILSALEALHFVLSTKRWQTDHRIRKVIPDLVSCLWRRLTPSRPEQNVEAARYILRLRKMSPENELIESSITALMIGTDAGARKSELDVEAGRRFVTLWTHSMMTSSESPVQRSSFLHGPSKDETKVNQAENNSFLLSRPLLLLIDSLFDPTTEIFVFVNGWISTRSTLQIIVDFLLVRLQRLSSIKAATAVPHEPGVIRSSSNALDDEEESLYFLRTVSNLIQYSNKIIWTCLSTQAPKLPLDHSAHDDKTSTDLTDKRKDSLEQNMTSHVYLIRTCLSILCIPTQQPEELHLKIPSLRLAAASLLLQLLMGPPTEIIWETDLDAQFIDMLSSSIQLGDVLLQTRIMGLILCTMRLRAAEKESSLIETHRRTASRDSMRNVPRSSISLDKVEKDQVMPRIWQPPSGLLDCLMLGLRSSGTDVVLEQWVQFLDDCLPYYAENMFQILMPLVDCFIKSLESIFKDLQAMFEDPQPKVVGRIEPISSIIVLLNGLEQILARAHDQLVRNDTSTPVIKSPEQTQGFFGNMVSGVFTPETNRSRTTTANNRLTVLLCFKDAVRLGLKIWSWGDHRLESSLRTSSSASFNYTSLRLKNRIRRVLEHIFVAEALECLETLIEAWYRLETENGQTESTIIFNLLHALDGSRPRNTIPAIFNAMYSRTNPSALDPVRKSTLTSDMSDLALAGFLVAYTRSLEDDAMDEIWTDCLTFLKDVLTNPLPHRQTLPKLLEFTAVLGEKVDNTNFGEQRRMRRDLGDLFLRILAASFTTKPLGFSRDASPAVSAEKTFSDSPSLDLRKTPLLHDIVAIIASILPHLSKILIDSDRVAAATATISTQVLIPTFRWKSYPQNVTQSILDILYALARIPEASKTWRKDVAEAFNDPRFFCASSLGLAHKGWLPILRQWALLDKDRMSEFLTRLSPPTSAGIMFGVGASSARLEADRKTQLTLRKAAVLVLASADDAFIVNIAMFHEKLVELMTATAASSPSSVTRAEIYMLLRALVLKTSPVHMTAFWPFIHSELSDAISSLFPEETHDTYNAYCVLQACKLLEVLLILAPDDFQMREWLFVTDTIYAVYRPTDWDPVALVDVLVEDLDSKAGISQSATVPLANATHSGKRKPLLTSSTILGVPKEELISRVLRPFFRQLSINVFESTYSMETPDWQACHEDLLIDLFDDSTVV